MELTELKKYEPIYVIGHINIDTDSAVASKILCDILNDFGVKAYYAILDEKYTFDEYNAGMVKECMDFNPVIIKKEEVNKYNWFLVDHNDRHQSVGLEANVLGAIDHHPYANNVNNVEITDVCSTALHIFNKYKDKYNFTKEQKYQIYMAFLNDSTFGKSSRYKDSDEEIAKQLGFEYDYNELFKKFFVTTDISQGVHTKMKNGQKKYQFDNVYFESNYIEQFGIEQLNEYKKIVNNLESFLGVWVDYENEKTYAYFKYDGELIEYKYDFIASRATTILNDVIKYLKERNYIEDNETNLKRR